MKWLIFWKNKPGKLLRHLKDVRGFQIREEDAGILKIIGTFVPIQILVTKELTKEENRWLSSLSNRLEEGEWLAELLKEYEISRTVNRAVFHGGRRGQEDSRKILEFLI